MKYDPMDDVKKLYNLIDSLQSIKDRTKIKPKTKLVKRVRFLNIEEE
jgi:hypothetical protein